jgi:formylmethanofuran dehydrogenase subunit E
MTEARCTVCNRLFLEEELLVKEDDGQLVCADCSGLLGQEDLGCEYVEEG